MKKIAFFSLILFFIIVHESFGQRPVLAVSQVGYRQDSPKTATLIPTSDEEFSDSIVFYIHQAGYNLPRNQEKPGLWDNSPYPYPYDVLEGKFGKIHPGSYDYKGWLVKKETRWGTVWQADFSEFEKEGLYQIETEMQFSVPFQVEEYVYDKFLHGYLEYIHSQRSAADIYGIRKAEHLDDAQIDSTGEYRDVAGGWYNAGDLRKWLSLTLFNLEALHHLYVHGAEQFREEIIDEIRWGNRYFHNMITKEGRVYEDVAGGNLRGDFKYEDGWWAENHPGCIANNAGNYFTDNIPNTGDERQIRTTYNPFVQLAFVRNQALVSNILPAANATRSLYLAEMGWKYAQRQGHDNRTLFLAQELDAALELKNAGSELITEKTIAKLTEQLLNRQDHGTERLSHYFLEKDAEDAYRSVAFSGLPVTALMRAVELDLVENHAKAKIESAIRGYIDNFLLADAKSNPYGVTPYGAFIKKPRPEFQLFRDAGRGRGVRTFIHPFNEQMMIHGTNATVMNQAFLLAKAGYLFRNQSWKDHAEKLLQWTTGHNPEGLSLFFGIGPKALVPFSTVNINLPYAGTNGFIGRADDTPYLETSNAIEWNTQEIWDVPFQYAVGAAVFLNSEE